MNTYIYMNEIDNNSRLRNFIENKIKTSLKRFDYLIKKVEVRMTDENGPKGGDDKSCMVYVRTDLFPDIIINGTKPDAYASASDAIVRAKRTLARRVKHSRSFTKTPLNTQLSY